MVDEGHVLYILYIYVFEEKKSIVKFVFPPKNS